MFILIGPVPSVKIETGSEVSFEQSPSANQFYDFAKGLFDKHRDELKAGINRQIAVSKSELQVRSGSISFNGQDYKYSLTLGLYSFENPNDDKLRHVTLEVENKVYSGSLYELALKQDNGEKRVYCCSISFDNIPVQIQETRGNTPIRIVLDERDLHSDTLRVQCANHKKVLTMVLNKLVSEA